MLLTEEQHYEKYVRFYLGLIFDMPECLLF